MSPLVPSWLGVGLSVVLVAVTLAVVVRARLGLARDVLVACLRAAAQLVAVGALLRVVFERTGVPGSLAWVAGMVVVAGGVAARRGAGVPHARLVGTVAIGAGVAATLGLLVGLGVVESAPRVVVPVGGMVVSAAMQGTSLTLLRLRDEVASSRRQVEARLALGLPAAEAFAPHLRAALRNAVAPTVDSTRVVGLITLPGAMTGLILAGVAPLTAIRYQIVVMYLGLSAASLAGFVAARLATRALFDEAHRLRPLEPAARPRLRRWRARARMAA